MKPRTLRILIYQDMIMGRGIINWSTCHGIIPTFHHSYKSISNLTVLIGIE